MGSAEEENTSYTFKYLFTDHARKVQQLQRNTELDEVVFLVHVVRYYLKSKNSRETGSLSITSVLETG